MAPPVRPAPRVRLVQQARQVPRARTAQQDRQVPQARQVRKASRERLVRRSTARQVRQARMARRVRRVRQAQAGCDRSELARNLDRAVLRGRTPWSIRMDLRMSLQAGARLQMFPAFCRMAIVERRRQRPARRVQRARQAQRVQQVRPAQLARPVRQVQMVPRVLRVQSDLQAPRVLKDRQVQPARMAPLARTV